MSLFGGIIGQLLGGVLSIVGALTQTQTNGASLLGTLSAPLLPQFLTNNPLPNGFPWGLLTAIGTNPYTGAPFTGVIRNYDFTVTRGTIAPDGYQMSVILINGQFPGPTIEANWGDTIIVTVHNQITGPAEGTAFHWHGLLQQNTPYMDGVPGAQQCPIAPGSSFTYSFTADLYGTSWYHSHYSAQYSGGLLGPMIIHGPSNYNYDIDLGPVFLTDWYHTPYYQIVQEVVEPNGNPAPFSDNNLINGKGVFNCSSLPATDKTPCNSNAGLARFTFQQGKSHRLRLINAGAEGLQRFSIDGHTMTVIANDFVPIKPYTTNVVTLGIGQRTDVVVTANAGNAQSSWWMRSNISTICSLPNQPYALAGVYYNQANTAKNPTSTAWNVPDPGTCQNDPLASTVPYFSIPAATPSTTKELDVNFGFNATGSFLWTLDGISFRADYNTPILSLADQGNFTYPPVWNVKNFGSNSTVRVNVENLTPVAHPMHFHGHNMQILHEGPGKWDGVTIINPSNPQRRDVQMLPALGHMVFQYTANNPGVWPFHCHIAWHVSAGLYANFLEQPAQIKSSEFQIPLIISETCLNWQAWTNKNKPDQIDSGV